MGAWGGISMGGREGRGHQGGIAKEEGERGLCKDQPSKGRGLGRVADGGECGSVEGVRGMKGEAQERGGGASVRN